MNKIKANLEKAFSDFIKDFANPKTLAKGVIEDKIKCKIQDVFKSQKSIDYAKSVYGKKGLNIVIALYLSQFQGQLGINYLALDTEIKMNHRHLLRHLGPDKLQFLKLMVMLLRDLNSTDNKPGLLYKEQDEQSA